MPRCFLARARCVNARNPKISYTEREATMKRIMIAALAVVMLVSVSITGMLPVHAATAEVHDHGTVAVGTGANHTEPLGPDFDSYKSPGPSMGAQPVGSVTEWLAMDPAGSYYLTADLTIDQTWAGTFTGKLFGEGHTITQSVPLFEKLDGATVRDLILEGDVTTASHAGALAPVACVPKLYGIVNYTNVTTTNTSNYNGWTGGLIGLVDFGDGSTIFSYCINYGTINGDSQTYNDVGGLAGFVRGGGVDETYNIFIMEHCANYGTIDGQRRNGGLIGCLAEGGDAAFYSVRISNCGNYGPVSSNYYTGGITSRISAKYVTVENCINTGTLTAKVSGQNFAGIVAHMPDVTNATFRNCRNEGEILNAKEAGGIYCWGYNANFVLTIENCSNTADITATSRPGGIVGVIDGGTTYIQIKDCTNEGHITSTTNYPGGIAGRLDTSDGDTSAYPYNACIVFDNCVNKGAVTGALQYAGGMLGYAGGSWGYSVVFNRCVNYGEISMADSATSGNSGGMAGSINSVAKCYDCVNYGDIYGYCTAGGMVASTFASVATVDNAPVPYVSVYERCVNYGDIYSNGANSDQCGGLTGWNAGAVEMTDCANYGDIWVANNDAAQRAAAGLAACTAYYGTFTNCVNYGNVVCEDQRAGGIAGFLGDSANLANNSGFPASLGAGTFVNCYNYGDITAEGERAAGIAAYVKGTTHFESCLNTGDISAPLFAAGIAATTYLKGTYYYCVSTGDITCSMQCGGIFGKSGDGTNKADQNGTAGATAIGCVVAGTITNDGTRMNAGDPAGGVGGIGCYVYGSIKVNNCVVLADINATFVKNLSSTAANGVWCAGAMICYANNGGCEFYDNYFGGTIVANKQCDTPVYIVFANRYNTNTAKNIAGNYSTQAMPLAYHGNADKFEAYGEATTITADQISNGELLTRLTSGNGVAAWVQTTNCDGLNAPVYKLTADLFAISATHDGEDAFSKFTADETHHWYECPSCAQVSPEGKTEHFGGEATCRAKAICQGCYRQYGEKDMTNHTEEATLSCDAYTHTYTYNCCYETETSEHEFGITADGFGCVDCGAVCEHSEILFPATCNSGAICAICLETCSQPDPTIHESTSFIYKVNGEGHDVHYACCDAYVTTEAHSVEEGTVPTCTEKLKCQYCQKAYGELDPDNHASTEFYYVVNGDQHDKVHACCDAVAATEAHSAPEGVAATCQNALTCQHCHETYGQLDPNNHTSTELVYAANEQDPTTHAVTHPCCGASTTQAHAGGTATCKDKAVCTACGTAYGETLTNHTYDNGCDEDCNACGEVRDTAHTFGEWTVVTPATETETGLQERTCSACGKKSTATISVITNSESALQQGAEHDGTQDDSYIGVIVIVGAAVIVIGLVTVAVIARKNKKKR